MALVVPPPTTIPNALNPTTAAVERDTQQREITPAVTAQQASASTADSTSQQPLDYPLKSPSQHGKGSSQQGYQGEAVTTDDNPSAEAVDSAVLTAKEQTLAEDALQLAVDPHAPPEVIIHQALRLKQQILARSNLDAPDRWLLSEANDLIRHALVDLTRRKQIYEVKQAAPAGDSVSAVIKAGSQSVNVSTVALTDLFAVNSNPDSDQSDVSPTVKLAGAVVGQFYEDNIEPALPQQIDLHQ